MTFSQDTAGEGGAPSAEAADLLLQLASAYSDMRESLTDFEQLLSQATFDRARLTTVHLKLAQLRLARGPLVGKIAAHLEGKLSDAQAAQMKELRESHDQMLQASAAHTNKWTVDAIESNWSEYRTETAKIVRSWIAKVTAEHHFIYPLLRRE